MSDFIHIHNHSQYSKFDGFSTIEGLVKKAKSFGMRAVGLTDHGTFAGAIEFIKTCRENKIKPIIGVETYLSRNHRCHDRNGQPDNRKGNRHLNVIAKNYKGFQNLCALSQHSFLEGYYYDPRIDFELLSKHREGLIVTSACLSSVVNWNLSIDRYEKAKQTVALFKDIFGDDFYLEAMYHGIDAEAKVLPGIQQLAQEMDVKIIATNDCHYLEKEDSEFHEYIMCISSGRTVKDPKRIKFPYKEFYFKSPEEMSKIFGHMPSAMLNTIEIADKCDYSDLIFMKDGGQMRLPKFPIPESFASPNDYLDHLCKQGLQKIGLHTSTAHVERLNQELSDLKLIWKTKDYDFATYFLMIADVFDFAKREKIACGIRGSGYGALSLKCLGLTEGVDPILYGLMWERFLGFDNARFVSDDDIGIKPKNRNTITHSVKDTQKDDASGIMFDRYK